MFVLQELFRGHPTFYALYTTKNNLKLGRELELDI